MIKKKPIRKYEDLNIVALDIETTGLEIGKDKLLVIGLLDKQTRTYKYFDFTKRNQKETALRFFTYLKNLKDKHKHIILTGHNLLGFDIPFLYWYFTEELGLIIDKWFSVNFSYEYPVSNVLINGRQHFIHPVKTGFGVELFDTFIQLVRWDFVARKLTNYNLKSAVVELELIERNDRLILQEENFKKAVVDDEMLKYLKQDLEDTLVLTDFLMPSKYYAFEYLPKEVSLTKFFLMGNASLWEIILKQYYSEEYYKNLKADEKYKYRGAITGVRRGIFKGNIYKIDIGSLYPTIMINYKIHSKKDFKGVSIKICDILRTERLKKWKPLAKKGNKEAKAREGAIKLLINSLYGYWGTANMRFNSMESASKITEYGRKVLTAMIKTLEDLGASILEVDTDGIIFSGNNDIINKFKYEIYKIIPEVFTYDVEFEADVGIFTGKKQYVIIKDRKPIIKKGIFAKRDIAKFEIDFYIEYTIKLVYNGLIEAEKYKQEVIENILNADDNILDWLATEKTIKKTDKNLIKLGLQPRTRGKFWYDVDKITRTGKKHYKPTLTKPKDFSYYIEKINKIADEVKTLYYNPDKQVSYGIPLEKDYKLK